MEFINLENKKFGMLTVLKLAPKTKNRSTLWLCQCDCGNIKTIRNKNLIEGIITDCGCVSKNQLKENQKIGRLTLITQKSNGRGNRWECLCECGNTISAKEYSIRQGVIKSCGCLKKEYAKMGNPVHKFNGTRLQRIYFSMKKRCYNKNHIYYKNYGGRGIRICDEWLGEKGIANFIEWSLMNGYDEKLSIDRIDNNGNYCPQNCKWSSAIEQQNNTRINRKIVYNGETLTLSEASRKFKISVTTLHRRIKKWGDVCRAIEEPIHIEKSRIKKGGGD